MAEHDWSIALEVEIAGLKKAIQGEWESLFQLDKELYAKGIDLATYMEEKKKRFAHIHSPQREIAEKRTRIERGVDIGSPEGRE
ncbi:MAG TPA: hypothetical protein VIL58_08820 [Thermoplasmata archaeon]|nr:hypothetical protein [Thermoplasmata archaeon]